MRIGAALLLIAVRTLSKSAVTPSPQRHRGVTGGDVLKIVGGVGRASSWSSRRPRRAHEPQPDEWWANDQAVQRLLVDRAAEQLAPDKRDPTTASGDHVVSGDQRVSVK
jgi:hypothetical protein